MAKLDIEAGYNPEKEKVISHDDNTFTLHLCTGEAQALLDILRQVSGTSKRRKIADKILNALTVVGVDETAILNYEFAKDCHGMITFGTEDEYHSLSYYDSISNPMVKEHFKNVYSSQTAMGMTYGINQEVASVWDAKKQKWVLKPVPPKITVLTGNNGLNWPVVTHKVDMAEVEKQAIDDLVSDSFGNKWIKCNTCDGSGIVKGALGHNDVCWTCWGSGQIKK